MTTPPPSWSFHQSLVAAVLARDERTGWDRVLCRRRSTDYQELAEASPRLIVGGMSDADLSARIHYVEQHAGPVTLGQAASAYLRGVLAVHDRDFVEARAARGRWDRSWQTLAALPPPIFYAGGDRTPNTGM